MSDNRLPITERKVLVERALRAAAGNHHTAGGGCATSPEAGDQPLGSCHVILILAAKFVEHHPLFGPHA